MKDTVALITGGAGHIGSEIARKLAIKGARIVVLDKDEKKASVLIAELKSKFGTEGFFLNVDLMDPNSFESIRKTVDEKFGRLDFVVNNAAFYDSTPGWGVPFEEEGYDAWLKVMRVNLLAPFFLIQKLAPLLKKSQMASVVNVSSIYGVVGPDHRIYDGLKMTNPAAYAASKGGLIQVTKWLSTVLAPEVRVNTVTPGGVERGQNETFVERYKEKTPLKRMATESDVANAISYLLSPESSYVTGQNLIVDGGWTVW